ncbi:MAG: efflux RND transporter permease subunit [Proteobacteria bacterium]|nr:efflux RND transporter permease subunit [Pseudomonadota bacterium]MDA1286375.1 efflux RND transporter permease subunit [Pseudomonadota bacterium]
MTTRGFPLKPTGGILSYFTRHKTVANLMLVLMVTLGVFAATKIRSQFFPDVVVETVSVIVRWDGAGPEDIDNGIVQVLEPALLSVEGVETSESTSREGSATIRLDFEPGWDMTRAADDVKVAADAVTGLPDEAEDPIVRRGQWRDRVTDVVVTGPVGTDQLARFTDEFVALLFREGVTRTTILGVSAPATVVEVNERALIQHDITMGQIAAAIGEEAAADPAGDVAGGTARVRTGVAKRSADEISGIVVRSNPDGSKIYVSDIATIRVEGVTRSRSFFVGENPAITIRVDRSDKGDAIEMQKTVQRVADELQATLPAGVKVQLIRTRAEAITDRLNILLDNGLMGLGMVVALLFLFLNARTAFWVAAGVPVAMAATIALMYVSGLTINMISLFALIITLGIVVDDAIVVGEHADFRHSRLGESPVEAAENAAKRMAAPVFSASITTIIAFFALTAIQGRFGTLIADIPFTVIVVLVASLAECFLILPHHMSKALAASAKNHWYDWPSSQFDRLFSWFRHTIFRWLMIWVVRLRYPVLAGVVLILISQVNLFLSGDVTWRFFNAPEQGSITGNFAMVPGAQKSDSLEMMRELQRATDELAKQYTEKYGTNPVSFVMVQIGGTSGRGLSGQDTKDPDLLGAISIELIDADLRTYSSFQFLGELQDAVRRHPMLETLSFRSFRSGPGGDSIDVQLYGASSEQLKAAAEALKAALAQNPEVSSLEDSLAYDKQELVLELTPQGQALGFTIDALGRELRGRLNGIVAASYPLGIRSAEIRVELPDGAMNADFLSRTMMRTPTGGYVALSDIVTVSDTAGFAAVLREDGLRVVTVTGDISEDDPKRAAEIIANLRDELLPRIEQDFTVSAQMAGLSEQENSFLADAQLGFSLALLGIYLTLAWVFSSWMRPLVVMVIIPFGLVGTIYGHHSWDIPMSMFTVVGLIGMTGIIINDSIVLVGTIDEYSRDRDMTRAIVDGAVDRLRPVLLTTLTTVLGLAPLLYETSSQAQFLKPTVITLSYGLGFGLVLVLLIVPSLVAMQSDIKLRILAFQRMLSGSHVVWSQRLVLIGAGLVTTAAFAGTVGYYVVYGRLMEPVSGLVPLMRGFPVSMVALSGFVVATLLVCVLAAGVSALAFQLTKSR